MNWMRGRGKAPAEAPKRARLYVENLSPRVTEYMLCRMFAAAGPLQHVKINSDPDRNNRHDGPNYGFVEYRDTGAAETAIQTLNGRKVFYLNIRVRWAYPDQGQQNKKDNSTYFRVFVGDLAPEFLDIGLANAFSAFGTLSDARVMQDIMGQSRGYGFLVFRLKTDAEQAIAIMNGAWLGFRAIPSRVEWADQRTQEGPSFSSVGSPMGGGDTAPAPVNFLRVNQANQRTRGGPSSSSVGSPMGGSDTTPAPVNFTRTNRANQRTRGGPSSSSVDSPMGGSHITPAPVNVIRTNRANQRSREGPSSNSVGPPMSGSDTTPAPVSFIRANRADQRTQRAPPSSSVGSPMGGGDTAPAPVNFISVDRADQRTQGGPSSSSVGFPMGGGDTAAVPVNVISVDRADQRTRGGPSSSSVGFPMGGGDTAPTPVNYISVDRADQRTQGGPSSSSVGSPMGGGDTAPAPANFISVDQADQRTQGDPSSSSVGSPMGGSDTAPVPVNIINAPLSYETVVQQTPADVTTVCVDNLDPHCTSVDLIHLVQTIGYLSDIHNHADRGFALIKMDTHEHAALAIFRLQGHIVHGRPIRCSWGVERASDPLSYEAVLEQTPPDVTTVRVVNLVPYCTQADLVPLFKPIGHLSRIHVDADRGFGSVKLDTHQRAAMAIVQLQGRMVHGRPIGCSWGVEAAGDPSAMW